jgi:hypothetical protein
MKKVPRVEGRRRDGRWTLPHRLVLHTAWTNVTLDLTSAVRTGPELIIEVRVRGGNVELVLAPAWCWTPTSWR